jgi:hypothetical protein
MIASSPSTVRTEISGMDIGYCNRHAVDFKASTHEMYFSSYKLFVSRNYVR